MSDYQGAMAQVKQYISEHPDDFRDLRGGAVIAKLEQMNKDLFANYTDAFGRDVESNYDRNRIIQWHDQNPGRSDELTSGIPLPPPAPVAPPPAPVKPDTTEQDAIARESAYQKKIDDMYSKLSGNLTDRIERAFAPGRSKLISEEAALGRLGSPVSIPTLSRYDEQKNNAITDAQSSLLGQQASGEFNLSNTIENVLAGERRAKEQSAQFNADLGLRRQTLDEQIRQAMLDRQSSMEVGRMQADAAKPTTLDRIFQGINAASGAASAGARMYYGGKA